MFDMRVPESLASLPGRTHRCADDAEDGILRVMKVCKACGESKPETDFSVRKEGSLRSYCKPCCSAKSKAWNQANRERYNAGKRARWGK